MPRFTAAGVGQWHEWRSLGGVLRPAGECVAVSTRGSPRGQSDQVLVNGQDAPWARDRVRAREAASAPVSVDFTSV